MLTDAENILARQRTYQLFSRLFAGAPGPALLPVVAAIPELAAHLPGTPDPDRAAAAHYHTFSDTVLPFESIFRDPSGLLGGDVTAAVAQTYAATGFSAAEEADSMAAELAFLAHLSAAERRALAAGDMPGLAAQQVTQQAFLSDHLLVWLPPFAAALAHGRVPFYAALGNLTLALAAEHLAGLPQPMPPNPPALPDPPDLLTDESTSLRRISATLLTPPYSGFYLSKAAISDLARAHKLPHGFGKRRQILRNLLETAGQYDSAGPLLDYLSNLVTNYNATHDRQGAAWPVLEPWLRPWQSRLAETRQMLHALRALLPHDP